MSHTDRSQAAIAVVRRSIEKVQAGGDFDVFDQLFADDFVDHTPQPGMTPDKPGVKILYTALRTAFADLDPDIHWQAADDNLVTTFKIYHGTHVGDFLGIAPTGRRVHFESVDAMRVVDGKIIEHWGVGNLYSLVLQLGGITQTEATI